MILNEDLWLEIKALFEAGGYVMPPLFICAALLWYGLGYRYWVLRNGGNNNPRDVLARYKEKQGLPGKTIIEQAVITGMALKAQSVNNLRRHLDSAFYPFESELRAFSTTIKAVVMISPLLGLLGTVSGMIETFDSLAEMALFTQSGGIAGGISQALFTTQMGLSVAIPGVLLQNVLNKRQRHIEQNLAQIKDLLCRQ